MIPSAMRSDNKKYNQVSAYERGRKDTTYAHILFFVCIIIMELILTMYKTNEQTEICTRVEVIKKGRENLFIYLFMAAVRVVCGLLDFWQHLADPRLCILGAVVVVRVRKKFRRFVLS